ncbi:hypothetical protein GGS23DRAFT_596116 [Durotheca rogersii]|uniref:uncharacterized protein n=1 Tax=Durotheca rogersii TaxID=419775 RepID=UPI0022206C9C|nr:uncharacterized protein GGS23DRAFT_596116 [Durotheca rogersii]KAI5863605.1 hypothetical protein GGS23DRAFT_596116 [Durotheca rogersii]
MALNSLPRRSVLRAVLGTLLVLLLASTAIIAVFNLVHLATLVSARPALSFLDASASASPSPGNHYETLGVPLFAPDAAIRAAYLRESRRHHPDKVAAAAAAAAAEQREAAVVRMRRVGDAYRALTGPGRCRYDFELGGGAARLVACDAARIRRDFDDFESRRRDAERQQPPGEKEKKTAGPTTGDLRGQAEGPTRTAGAWSSGNSTLTVRIDLLKDLNRFVIGARDACFAIAAWVSSYLGH